MRNECLLEETINGYSIEVFHDDIHPLDIIDVTIFESDDDLQEYLDQFRNGYLSMYCILVKKLCTCCNHAGETTDSLGGIEAETPKAALDYYFTAGYAPEYLEPVKV